MPNLDSIERMHHPPFTPITETYVSGNEIGRERLATKNRALVVTAYDDGWTIITDDETTYTAWPTIRGFTAEIKRCTGHGPSGLPDVCACSRKRTGDNGQLTAHSKAYCHELGHAGRVMDLAKQILKTYK